MNDQQAVELIVRSLDQALEPGEQAELESHLSQSEKTRHFAELVKKIENAILASRGIEPSGESGPGMNDLARARLQRELQRALAGQNAGGGDQTGQNQIDSQRLVAESETNYCSDQPGNTEDKL